MDTLGRDILRVLFAYATVAILVVGGLGYGFSKLFGENTTLDKAQISLECSQNNSKFVLKDYYYDNSRIVNSKNGQIFKRNDCGIA